MRDTLLFGASYNCVMSGNGSGCMLCSLSVLLLLLVLREPLPPQLPILALEITDLLLKHQLTYKTLF